MGIIQLVKATIIYTITQYSSVTQASKMTLLNIAVCFFTAGAVYLLVSQHYYDILREKDSTYWELANRQKTQQYNCEDQCKRQMDSNERYYSTLLSAYEDSLKTLLDTDVESIQMREKSYRQVIGVFQNHAVLVSEHSQTSTTWCAHYCYKLEGQLKICNTSLVSLKAERGRVGAKLRRQRDSLLLMHELIENNRSEMESCNLHTRWLSMSLVAILTLVATSITGVGILWTSRRVGLRGMDIPKEMNKDKIEDSEIETLKKAVIELKSQIEVEDQKRDGEALANEQLKHKLNQAESEALELRDNCKELEQMNTALQKHLDEKNQQLQELERLAKTKETMAKRKEKTIKFLEKRLAEKQENIASLVEANVANVSTYRESVSSFRESELKLLGEETKLKREVKASHQRAKKLADELNEAKKQIKTLGGHIRVQTVDISKLQHHDRKTAARIRNLNKKLLERTTEVKEKETELSDSKRETSQLKLLVETRDENLKKLQRLNADLKDINVDLDIAVRMKDNELEFERQSKYRALEGRSCQEGIVKSLRAQLKSFHDKVQRSSQSTKQKTTPQPTIDEAHVRLQLYEQFQLQYDQFETKFYGKLSDESEMAANLKTENRLLQMELEQMAKRNKALQELLDQDHARIRSQEQQEERMCRVTFDVYHPSLTPPHHTGHFSLTPPHHTGHSKHSC